MGYHIRLSKALSYSGVVQATKKHPDVFVEDKATADAAVGTGYFKLIEETAEEKTTAHLDAEQLNSMGLAELKQLAADMGIDTAGLKKAQIVDAIIAQEVTPGEETDEDGNEPDYGEGSPTMVELQEQK